MKKVIVIFGVLAFTAGMAFSQNNDASINQTGDEHEAIITQIGSLNESYVVQTDGSEGNNPNTVAEADIYQYGAQNYVNLNQRAFWGHQNSEAKIVQIGDNNTVRGMNEGDDWYQNQTGGLLDVRMEGDDNTLRSLRSEAQKNNNSLELDILGDGNDVAAAQEFGNATVDIIGDDNEVSLWQTSGANWDVLLYNNADIDIMGNNNDVNVHQTNNANNAIIDIIGSDNTASITQSAY